MRQGIRCRLPYKGEWLTLEEDDLDDNFTHLPNYIAVLFDSVLQHFNDGNVLPLTGGYYQQPKIFWELKQIGDSTRNRYEELEAEQRKK